MAVGGRAGAVVLRRPAGAAARVPGVRRPAAAPGAPRPHRRRSRCRRSTSSTCPWMARSRWSRATRRAGCRLLLFGTRRASESPRAGGVLGPRALPAARSRAGADRRRVAPGGGTRAAPPRPAAGGRGDEDRVDRDERRPGPHGRAGRARGHAAGLRPPGPGHRRAAEPRASHRGRAHAARARGDLPRGGRPRQPRRLAGLRSRRDLELHRPDRGRVRPGRPLPRARRARRAGRHSRLAHARRGARARRRGGGRRRGGSLAARRGGRRAGSARARLRGRARAGLRARLSTPSRASTSSRGARTTGSPCRARGAVLARASSARRASGSRRASTRSRWTG